MYRDLMEHISMESNQFRRHESVLKLVRGALVAKHVTFENQSNHPAEMSIPWYLPGAHDSCSVNVYCRSLRRQNIGQIVHCIGCGHSTNKWIPQADLLDTRWWIARPMLHQLCFIGCESGLMGFRHHETEIAKFGLYRSYKDLIRFLLPNYYTKVGEVNRDLSYCF